jgi:hypothetical protein
VDRFAAWNASPAPGGGAIGRAKNRPRGAGASTLVSELNREAATGAKKARRHAATMCEKTGAAAAAAKGGFTRLRWMQPPGALAFREHYATAKRVTVRRASFPSGRHGQTGGRRGDRNACVFNAYRGAERVRGRCGWLPSARDGQVRFRRDNNAMNARIALAALLLLLSGCDLPSLPRGNLPMPDMSGGPGFDKTQFNGKNYPDPHPESASDDAQRAAYQRHQQEQIDAGRANSAPDLSKMTCTGGSTSSNGANAGTFSSNTSCHN